MAFVPVFDGDLAGNDGRGATVAIIKDLQKVAPFGRIENRKAPVVEDQELNAADGFEQAAISAVAPGKGERFKQARHAMVLDRDCRGKPCGRGRRQSSSCLNRLAL